jgi:hypothetical protein
LATRRGESWSAEGNVVVDPLVKPRSHHVPLPRTIRHQPEAQNLPRHPRPDLSGATVAAAAIVGTSAALAPPASANSSFPEFRAVDAAGGVYWRNSANWNDTSRRSGYGFYNGDVMQLQCYRWGTTTPYSANHLWYWSYDYNRGQAGWVNDHFLTTPGTAAAPQPVTLPCG